MSLTREQLRNSVIANTNRSDKADLINDAINMALDEITMRHTFKSKKQQISVSVVAEDTSFVIPEGINRLLSVRVENSDGNVFHNLVIMPKARLERTFPALGQNNISGIPTYGYEENGVVYFLPKAVAAYSFLVTGDSLSGTFTSDSDTCLIPGVDPCIIAWATAWVFKSIEQFEDASVWDQRFEKSYLFAVRNDRRRPATELEAEQFPFEGPAYISDPYNDPFAGRS